MKDTTFEVGSMDQGEFFVSMEVWERARNFKWEVISVYGPTDHRQSQDFLEELLTRIGGAQLQMVVGGDFNLLRTTQNKSNARVDILSMQRFNDWVADLGLREINRVGERYTCTNRQASPTLSVLYWVFIPPDWELHFPSHLSGRSLELAQITIGCFYHRKMSDLDSLVQ
ncbi:putative anion transporter 2, chloroplastic [Hordeum vulgare]|nr:putative anion transporter 2, chloroplastic [Hordeum vulgare]